MTRPTARSTSTTNAPTAPETTTGGPIPDPRVLATLRAAIEDRISLAARYHGLDRLVCPHALGTKHGELHVLVYQTDGGSRSGLPAGGEWRCLRVADLEQVRPEPGPWRTTGNLFAAQSCLDKVDLVAQPLPPRAEGGRRRA